VRAGGHDELDFDAGNAPRCSGDTFDQGISHDLAPASIIPVGAEGVGVPAEGGVHGDALRDGQQGGEVGHGVRCRAEADTPLCGGVTRPLGDGTRVFAVGGSPGRRDNGAVPGAGERSGLGSEFVVDGAPAGRGQACCLLDEQGGAPFVELAGVQGGEGVRHFGHEGLGEAEQAAAAVGGFAAGEGDLRGHSLAPCRSRNPHLGLIPPLGGIEGDSDPSLQARDDAFEVLETGQLLDQPRTVTTKVQRTRRCDEVLHADTARSGA
jgi:hypothetical protein